MNATPHPHTRTHTSSVSFALGYCFKQDPYPLASLPSALLFASCLFHWVPMRSWFFFGPARKNRKWLATVIYFIPATAFPRTSAEVVLSDRGGFFGPAQKKKPFRPPGPDYSLSQASRLAACRTKILLRFLWFRNIEWLRERSILPRPSQQGFSESCNQPPMPFSFGPCSGPVQTKETRIMFGARTVCARNHSLFAAVDLLRPHPLFTSVSLVHQVPFVVLYLVQWGNAGE